MKTIPETLVSFYRIRNKVAFTLIELLTVVAIIGILAAIIIPTVGKVRETAGATRCLSNLRQVGVAMAIATEENRNRLPGPFSGGQGTPDQTRFGQTVYKAFDPATVSDLNSDASKLPVRLGPYMGLPPSEPAGLERATDLFLCPVFARKGYTGPSWLLATRIDREKGASTDHSTLFNKDIEFPFGYPKASDDPDIPDKYRPKRMDDIHAIPIPVSRLWALSDCDNAVPGTIANAGWKAEVPLLPIHGTSRNILFFDWHVGRMNAENVVLK